MVEIDCCLFWSVAHSLSPLFGTYERISILRTKRIKKLNFIYGTRIGTKQIWNNFSASPDLELSLAKTKKELRQAPNDKQFLDNGLSEMIFMDKLTSHEQIRQTEAISMRMLFRLNAIQCHCLEDFPCLMITNR